MTIQDLTFDELKQALANCNTKMLTFIIMLANGELMERCDRHILDKNMTVAEWCKEKVSEHD